MAPKRKLPTTLRAAKSNKRSRNEQVKTVVQLYTPRDEILVLGDGDFTFSLGLVKHRGTGKGIFATSYDSESTVKKKYSNAQQCITAIRAAQGQVLHDIDATNLDAMPRTTSNGKVAIPRFFQCIIFNFPHSGQQRVHINRALLHDFFESARSKVVKAGEVHVTLKTKPPYSNWLIEDQAKIAGFVLKERRKFNIRLFPGYHHRTTDPHAKKFEPDLCITYVFIVNRTKYPFEAIARSQVEIEDQQPVQSSTNIERNAKFYTVASESEAAVTIAENIQRKIKVASREKMIAPMTTSTTSLSLKKRMSVRMRVKAAGDGRLWTPLHRPSPNRFRMFRE